MKAHLGAVMIVLAASILATGCGSEGEGDGTGTVAIDIADAKPALPVEGVRSVYVTFSELSIHRSGGDWVSLPLPETPYRIDLLQFSDGVSTQFVPPVELEAGGYTQLRMQITEASLEVPGQDLIPLDVPSDVVRTDQTLEVVGGAAVDLTVHFDLSQSIVVRGDGDYELKPVLHLQETRAAAKVQGSITPGSFGLSGTASVTLYTADGEEYTSLVVHKADNLQATPFTIYWLVPGQAYQVTVAADGLQLYEEDVQAADVGPGETFTLGAGAPIVLEPVT